jgi:nucleoside-diphosphate-sugar epimerase
MRALVTGATGFLGSHLVERLRAAGYQVRALAHQPGRADFLADLGAEVVVGDLTAPESLARAVAGVDTVFHCAAVVSNWAPWSDFLAVTVRGTENLLRAAARVPLRRFVHVSTTRVYDDRHCRRLGVVTEETPYGPHGFRKFGHYARAKVLAESLVWKYAGSLPVSVIRPAWIYGPRDEAILPPLVKFLRSPHARWPSRADPCADPVYVSDVADCAIAAAVHPAAVGQPYNVAPADRISVREFLGCLSQALGVTMPRRSTPYPLAALAANVVEGWARLTRRRTAPAVNRAGLAILTTDVRYEPAKAQRDLGWRSQVDLADGVRRTAAWLEQRYLGVPQAGGARE